MSVKETHYVVWGARLGKLDYDEYEFMFNQYSPPHPPNKAYNAKDDISIIDGDMDGTFNVIGHIVQAANGSNGEGLEFMKLETVPEDFQKWMDTCIRVCGEWGIKAPTTNEFGWIVFTQYS